MPSLFNSKRKTRQQRKKWERVENRRSIEESARFFDHSLTRRVLANLIINAYQAITKKGEIHIEATQKEDNTFINIKDTGEGIPDEIKPNIFQPLFTTKPKGQGFGLAVAKRFVEAQKGQVTFKSEKGKGTTFTIKFPSRQRNAKTNIER